MTTTNTQINTIYRYNILSHLKQNWLSLHLILYYLGRNVTDFVPLRITYKFTLKKGMKPYFSHPTISHSPEVRRHRGLTQRQVNPSDTCKACLAKKFFMKFAIASIFIALSENSFSISNSTSYSILSPSVFFLDTASVPACNWHIRL